MKTTGKKINGRKVFTYVFLTIAALISLFPFYFMFVSATNTNAEILSATPKLIFGSHLVENFKNLNKKMDILRILMNSTIMTVTYTALSIILHSMAGYALAKFEFKGKGLLFSLIMVTMMIPSQVMYKMVVEQLEKAARNIHIKYQWENGCGRTCTDADAIHMAGRGIPTTVMSIPLRYMHNPAEVCSMEDVQGCIDVLAEFLCGIGSDICLKPLEG